MAEISMEVAEDLISKLLNERIPIHALLRTSSGAEARISGFVDSKTALNGLVVSTSGPPLVAEKGYLKARPFDNECVVWYGEKRELPKNQQHFADAYGESVILIQFVQFNETLVLQFTI
jgi:hypothetical protein